MYYICITKQYLLATTFANFVVVLHLNKNLTSCLCTVVSSWLHDSLLCVMHDKNLCHVLNIYVCTKIDYCILFPTAATVCFSTSSYRVTESSGRIQITLYYSYSLSVTSAVQVLTTDGTASDSG